MARYKSASARRDQKKAYVSGVIILGVLVAFAGIGWLWYTSVTGARELDKVTLCPSDPDSTAILLVDVTDPMTVAQRQDFRNQLDKLRDSIPRFGRLSIARVDSTSAELLHPVITRCNPGKASDVSEETGNPKKLQKLWDEGFSAPLQQAFETISQASPAGQSPIMESIQSVALTDLNRGAAATKPRKLVIVSDLLQHTNDIDFYKPLPDADGLINSPAFKKVRADLNGVIVELWMLQRGDSDKTQTRELIDLWEAVLREQGATVVRVYNVSGG